MVAKVIDDGRRVAEFTYGMSGQPTAITRRNGENERLWWRGLALTRRDYLNGKEVVSSERYLNEPHPGGGNPVLVWEGKAAPASAKERAMEAATRLLFNDMLGSTLAVLDGDKAQDTGMTLFGETPGGQAQGFFTGKPHIDELGYAFLFRNYRPEKAKWQTADPLGYPDGWNALAYCGNGPSDLFDSLGLAPDITDQPAYTIWLGYLAMAQTAAVGESLSSYTWNMGGFAHWLAGSGDPVYLDWKFFDINDSGYLTLFGDAILKNKLYYNEMLAVAKSLSVGESTKVSLVFPSISSSQGSHNPWISVYEMGITQWNPVVITRTSNTTFKYTLSALMYCEDTADFNPGHSFTFAGMKLYDDQFLWLQKYHNFGVDYIEYSWAIKSKTYLGIIPE